MSVTKVKSLVSDPFPVMTKSLPDSAALKKLGITLAPNITLKEAIKLYEDRK